LLTRWNPGHDIGGASLGGNVNGFRWIILSVFALGSVIPGHAQKFPLRPGEWSATNVGKDPTPINYCLNDELWQKALTQNASCKINALNITSTAASYSIDCSFKSFAMKGQVTLTFDGMEHMVGKGNFETTVNGKTSTVPTTTDYRWKGTNCSPDDMNLQSRAPR
jgi:hypothetical protein